MPVKIRTESNDRQSGGCAIGAICDTTHLCRRYEVTVTRSGSDSVLLVVLFHSS